MDKEISIFGKKDNQSEQSMQCKVEVFNAESVDIEKVKDKIFNLIKINWGEDALKDPDFTPEALEEILKNPKNTNIILRTLQGEIIGYSMAIPDIEDSENKTAYIYSTDINPSWQGKKLIGKIMEVMEEELKKRGYEFITRDSAVSNGYADSIEKHYANRIIDQNDHDSPYGLQRYFKIRL